MGLFDDGKNAKTGHDDVFGDLGRTS